MRFSSSPRGTAILAYGRHRDTDVVPETTTAKRTTRPDVLDSSHPSVPPAFLPVLRFHTFLTPEADDC